MMYLSRRVPDRLTAGPKTLTLAMVVRIHLREPKIFLRCYGSMRGLGPRGPGPTPGRKTILS